MYNKEEIQQSKKIANFRAKTLAKKPTGWEEIVYNTSSFRKRADYMARVLEGDDYNENSYADYYCNKEFGYISHCEELPDGSFDFESRMADFEELPIKLREKIRTEISNEFTS